MELISSSLILQFVVLPILFIFSFTPNTSAQFSFLHTQCNDIVTYTPGSIYQSNLNQTLNSLSSDTRITYGFYNFSAGQPPNRVEATALCRGDVPAATCRDYVRQAAVQIQTICPNQKAAFGLSDSCVIFYSNDSIFHRLLLKPRYLVYDAESFSGTRGLNRTLSSLLQKLENEAASGDSRRKYAEDKVDVGGNRTIYAVVQCNPDLSRNDCVKCVQVMMGAFTDYLSTPNFISVGARITVASCNLRYEQYPFYGNVTDLALPPAPAPSTTDTTPTTPQDVKTKKSGNIKGFIIIPIVGSLVLTIIAFTCMLWRKKKQRKHGRKFDKEEIETLESLQFSLATIKVATEDFSDHNKLGQGGFGTVYKGTLPDKQEVAVKRLSTNSGQGDVQFKNEILILAKLLHKNLVRLLGFCLEGQEMILIYELMANKSLDTFLVDSVQRASLLWETRYKLINGIAKGLQYLHEDSRLRIIHRDLKAGNVLLDAEFNPKIADFGMARLFNIDQTRAVTKQVVGTYGYMPPEYLRHGQVSIKLDVFSFGVLVLEIVSGSTISTFGTEENPENLLSFAWKNWQQGTVWNVVDPILSTASRTEIIRCIHIGLLCVQHNQAERPTMSSIALMLSSSSMSLPAPSQPAFFIRSDTTSNLPDSQGNGMYSINEVSLTMPSPR